MSNPVRILCLLVALGVSAVACGGDDTSTPATTTNPPETSSSEATTTTEPASGPIAPLTGESTDEDLSDRPVLAVKIDNNDEKHSRPQVGIRQADIVYEAITEGVSTRWMAVFHSELPEVVEPTRSARSTDIDLLTALSRPFFAYSGSNPGVAGQMRSFEENGYFDAYAVDGVSSESHRDPDRPKPYNLVLDVQNFLDVASEERDALDEPVEVAVEPVFTYWDPNSTETLDAPTSAGVQWDTHQTSQFVWDDDLGKWVRIQEGTFHVDGDGEKIAVDNVVVLFVDYQRSRIDPSTSDALTVGLGDAWVFSDGKLRLGAWFRDDRTDQWNLSLPFGAGPLELKPGKTWVYIADANTEDLAELTDADAQQLVADATAAAES